MTRTIIVNALAGAVILVVAALFLASPVLAAQCGIASWYGPGFHGRTSASGERFDQNAMTAAHKTLPFGTRVKVIDQRTGKAVSVRISDRGPFVRGRVVDLSRGAARELGIEAQGVAQVCIHPQR